MISLSAEVHAFISTHQLIRPGAPVVVAVSGGPDSLCLLDLLRGLRDQLGVSLHVAHLDHMIRGAESADEARFVADLAAGWGLPATVAEADVPAIARSQRLNLHAAARIARYHFLADVARAVGAQAVAVAQHANDQAETVLLHLLRGAGLEGLRGMRPAVEWDEWRQDKEIGRQGDRESEPVSPSPRLPVSPSLIRPLLHVTRETIERYCAELGLDPRRDPTNADLDATRNRLRHDLLPRLIEYNPHIVAALGRTAAICADDLAFIGAALDTHWPRLATRRELGVDFDGAVWRELPPALQRAALRRAHAQLAPGVTLGLEHVEQARALIERGVGRRAELPGGVPLMVGYGGSFVVGEPPPLAGPQLPVDVLELPAAGRAELGGGWALEIARQPGPPEQGQTAWEVELDAEHVRGPLVARRRRPGDRIRLRAGERRLQDVFVDAKVPRALRAAWPLIATSTELLWIPGLHAAANVVATTTSEQIIWIRIYQDR